MATGTAGSSELLNDIHIWDVELGKLAYKYSNGSKHICIQNYLAFSSNSKLLLGWSTNGIAIYNAIYTTTKIDPVIGEDIILLPNPIKAEIDLNKYNFKEGKLKIELIDQTGKILNILFDNTYADKVFFLI